jgi:predicted nucleic acid-binding protein
MRVLVDTSVWIDFFRGSDTRLDRLIEEDLVVTNEVILTELIPALRMHDQIELIDNLTALESIELSVDWDLIREMQVINLKNGVNKIGIPDIMIAQQCIENHLTLYSFDKHFTLMQDYFEFQMI